MQYAHRNGETEPPTRTGDFWLLEPLDGSYDGLDDPEIFHIHTNCAGQYFAEEYNTPVDGGSTDVRKIKGRWWGPIPKPEVG